MKRRKTYTKPNRRNRKYRSARRPKRHTAKPTKQPKRSSRRPVARDKTKHAGKRQALLKRRLPRPKRRRRRSRRQMVTFSGGQRHLVVLSRRMAGTNGGYLNAVRRLLHTNEASGLNEFAGQSIKDIRGHEFPLETRPNALYRANAVPEPIAEIYQVIA